MMPALATLLFLSTLWLMIVAAARLLEDSGAQVLRALRGEPRATMIAAPPVRARVAGRNALTRPLRARPTLRAAA